MTRQQLLSSAVRSKFRRRADLKIHGERSLVSERASTHSACNGSNSGTCTDAHDFGTDDSVSRSCDNKVANLRMVMDRHVGGTAS